MEIIYPTQANKPYIYDGRRIIIVRTLLFEQAFYQSSGINTSVPGTWFPFDGIDRTGKLNKNWITLHIAKYKFGIKKCIAVTNDQQLSWKANTVEKIKEMFCRLGNCYYATISQALGGPLWAGDIGKIFTIAREKIRQRCVSQSPPPPKEEVLARVRWERSPAGILHKECKHLFFCDKVKIPKVIVRKGGIPATPKEINNFVGAAISINFRENTNDTPLEKLFKYHEKKAGYKLPLDLRNFLNKDGTMKNNLYGNAAQVLRGSALYKKRKPIKSGNKSAGGKARIQTDSKQQKKRKSRRSTHHQGFNINKKLKSKSRRPKRKSRRKKK